MGLDVVQIEVLFAEFLEKLSHLLLLFVLLSFIMLGPLPILVLLLDLLI